jgi:hypothetical protein
MSKQLQMTKDQILDRLNQLPRISDFSSQDGRLTNLETRMSKAETSIGTLQGLLDRPQPFRDPPRH